MAERLRWQLKKLVLYLVRHDVRIARYVVEVLGTRLYRGSARTRVIAMHWLDEYGIPPQAELRASLAGVSFGPKIDGRLRVEAVELPAVRLYRFTDARICSNSSSVLLRDRILVERSVGVDPRRCSYSAGFLLMHGQRSAYVCDLEEEYIERGLSLCGNGSFNYYHWTVELLAKLEFVGELGRDSFDLPLLVNKVIVETPSMREMLRALAPRRDLVVLESKKTYRVGELIYINAPSTCPFNLRPGESSEVSDFLFRPSSIDYLRDALSSMPGPSTIARKKRVFFARRQGRRNYNQDEVFEILASYGFERVFMEELTAAEQIQVVSNADLLAGPSGAAWTNVIHSRPGTQAVFWMAEEARDFSCWSNLAELVGVDLRCVTFPTGARSAAELYDRDYVVDATRIRLVVESLLGDSDQ
ncbi:MAG: glycosyltransferase family 61 protein [Actinomycetes bacterium]